jgi:hypothetical protein
LQNTANGSQIAPQGLVAGEQRAACDGEIFFAALAAEAQRALRTAGLVGFYRTAGGANRGAVGIGLTNHLEGRLGFRISHAEDLSEAQGLCRFAATVILYATGEKQFKFVIRSGVRQSRDMQASVNETRRIGEARVRAYVDISNCEILFVGLGVLSRQAHPMVRIIATNTGQSPARNFVWNPTVQYFNAVVGAPSRSLIRELGSNWRNILGVGIAVNQSETAAAMIPEMELLNFLGESASASGIILVRLRDQFEFEDGFDERNTGEAYFSGMFKRIEGPKPMTPWGENQWSGQLTRLHRPSDWPEG